MWASVLPFLILSSISWDSVEVDVHYDLREYVIVYEYAHDPLDVAAAFCGMLYLPTPEYYRRNEFSETEDTGAPPNCSTMVADLISSSIVECQTRECPPIYGTARQLPLTAVETQHEVDIHVIWQADPADDQNNAPWLRYLLGHSKHREIVDRKYEVFANNSVIVYHAEQCEELDVAEKKRFVQYLQEFDRRQFRYAVIHLHDEKLNGCRSHYPLSLFVVRNVGGSTFVEGSAHGNVLVIPYGPSGAVSEPGQLHHVPANRRQYTWSFVGDSTKSSRREMLAAFQTVQDHFVVETVGWENRHAVKTNEYREILKQTVFVPCAAGTVVQGGSFSTIRMYEALEHGAVPIALLQQNDSVASILGPLFSTMPILTVQSWVEGARLAQWYLDRPDELVELQTRVQKWWGQLKRSVQQQMTEKMSMFSKWPGQGFIYNGYGVSRHFDGTYLFRTVEDAGSTSYLITSASMTHVLPGVAMWSHCKRCAFEDGHVKLFHHDGQRAFPNFNSRMLAKPRHGIYFDRPSTIYGAVVRESYQSSCAQTIIAPVYIALLWSVKTSFGYVFLDILEPIYSMMMRQYGRVRPDAVIYIEVAQEWERAELSSFLAEEKQRDGPWSLVFLLASSVRSFDDIRNSSGRVCFSDLHIGQDYSQTYFADGLSREPTNSIIEFPGPRSLLVKQGFAEFREFLVSSFVLQKVDESRHPTSHQPRIAFITRVHSRRFVNLEQMKATASRFGSHQELVFEKLAFTEQFQQLQTTDVLVGTYGSGAHNCIFLPRNAVLLLILQPGWYGWKWLFANKALLSGVHVVSYKRHADQEIDGWDGVRTGLWSVKELDIDVNIPHFARTLQVAVSLSSHRAIFPRHEVVGPPAPEESSFGIHVQLLHPVQGSIVPEGAEQIVTADVWLPQLDRNSCNVEYASWVLLFLLGGEVVHTASLTNCNIPYRASYVTSFSAGKHQLECRIQESVRGKARGGIAASAQFGVSPQITIRFPEHGAKYRSPAHRQSPLAMDLGKEQEGMLCMQLDGTMEQCVEKDAFASAQVRMPEDLVAGEHRIRIWFQGTNVSAAVTFHILPDSCASASFKVAVEDGDGVRHDHVVSINQGESGSAEAEAFCGTQDLDDPVQCVASMEVALAEALQACVDGTQSGLKGFQCHQRPCA
jgi:hypothetical protein